MWEESARTYLKVDGPVPIGIEGIEEEVCIGGGIWGGQGTGWGVWGCLVTHPPPQATPAGGANCVLVWSPCFPWDRGRTKPPGCKGQQEGPLPPHSGHSRAALPRTHLPEGRTARK